MEILYATVTILSLLGAILAYIAKLRWSNQYKEAKEAQIDSLNEQINQLKEFKSDQIMSLYKSTKEGLEEFNRQILAEKEELAEKVDEMEQIIEELKEKNKNSFTLPDLSKLEKLSKELDIKLTHFSSNYKYHMDAINKTFNNVNAPDFIINNGNQKFFIEIKKKGRSTS